jgi:hypothetical protein
MRMMHPWLRMIDFMWCFVFIYFETFYLYVLDIL